MAAFFVTSTGTDIGKTYVTAGLLRVLRGGGASAIKPVASGFTTETAATSDPVVLLEAMGEVMTPEALARISPWRFAEPLSPDMAAAREGRIIDYDALIEFCRAGMGRARGPFFVEGVGGVMVPLDARRTVRDWMAALGLPIVLVVGSYLGTISHTLTALDVLARARLRVGALVVNESSGSTVPLGETIAALHRFAGAVPIASLGRSANEEQFRRLWRVLCGDA
ncbi:MAG TPA: dethiobiotin synthase [Rhizomicrobium sp.]|nr:dethiobiotin synthase [Rhizomicrobium sp.]